jgi:hypothetical protein
MPNSSSAITGAVIDYASLAVVVTLIISVVLAALARVLGRELSDEGKKGVAGVVCFAASLGYAAANGSLAGMNWRDAQQVVALFALQVGVASQLYDKVVHPILKSVGARASASKAQQVYDNVADFAAAGPPDIHALAQAIYQLAQNQPRQAATAPTTPNAPTFAPAPPALSSGRDADLPARDDLGRPGDDLAADVDRPAV